MSFASLLLEPELPVGPDTPGVIVARPEVDEVALYFDRVAAGQAGQRNAVMVEQLGVRVLPAGQLEQ